MRNPPARRSAREKSATGIRYRAIAEYYDAEYANTEMLRHDVPFFLGQLPKKRQSVLELAVGTARAAIPIAQAGHRVVGVDYAPDLLEIAARKRVAVGLKERDLELHLGRAAILGTEFVLANDFVPSQARYQPGLIIERRHLSQLVGELAGLDRFLAGRSSHQGRLF